MFNKSKYLFIIGILFLGIQSCGKDKCYECTKAGGGVTTIQNFCTGSLKAKLTINGNIDSVSMGGMTADTYASGLTSQGYTCK